MADTLPAALDEAAAAGGPWGIELWDRQERSTELGWAGIAARAREVAGGLIDRGVRPGDTVAIVLPTSAAFFDAFFGVLCAGAIPVPLYPPVRLGRLDEYHARTAAMLRAARCRLILTDARVWRLLGEATRRAAPELGCELVSEVRGPPRSVDVQPESIGLVQFSSGTTVDPKPVALSHRALLAQTDALLTILSATPDPRFGASWLPLYHDMGLIGCVFPALRRPGRLTLLAPEDFIGRPASWLRALSRSRAVVSPAPNFAYALCVDRIRDEELDGVDLSAWRFALNGAEPVAPETLRRFVSRFAPWGLRPEALTPVYGLAEAALAVTFSDWSTPFRTTRFDRAALASGRAVEAADGAELVSVGRAVPGMEVEAPEGAIGPVRARGSSLFTGYLHQPEATSAALSDGWLDTGDLGFLHGGELYLTGRKKDLLVIRGRNHAPQEVEQAVDGVEGVRTGCAAAVSHRPEGAEGERLIVFVELREGATVDGCAAACHAAILRQTGLDVDEVLLLTPGTLPRTSSGKIRRQEALRLHLAGTLAPPAPVTLPRVLGAMIRGTLAHWMR